MTDNPDRTQSCFPAGALSAGWASIYSHDVISLDHGELPIEAADLEKEGKPFATGLRRTNIRGLRRVVFNFMPQWFLVTMGTGNVAIILYFIPFRADWLYWLSVVIFALVTLLFGIFMVLSLARYILYPQLISAVFRHSVQAFYLGPITVSFASITNLMARICLPAWGDWTVTWIWTFWWINVFMAISVQVSVMFCVFRYHNDMALDEMAAAWMLPSISSIAASSCSGIVASVVPLNHALLTLTIGLILWSCGIFLSLIIMAQYFHRLTLGSLPSKHLTFSMFLPLGPLSQGAHGIIELSKAALSVWPAHNLFPHSTDASQVFYVMAWLTALLFWGFAIIWLVFAIVTLIVRRGVRWNMSCWSLIFPTGVFALTTMQLGNEMESLFLEYLGTVFTGMNVVCWLVMCGFTVRGIRNGTAFESPTKAK